MFEYGVILNGSQTHSPIKARVVSFEYGVILNVREGGPTELSVGFVFLAE